MSERKSATKQVSEATAPLELGEWAPAMVGIRELRDHLSRHLERVKGGATITVTEHGRPIAAIVPMRFSERTLELWRQGKVNLPTLPKGDPRSFHKVRVEDGIQDILREVRGG